MQERGGDLSHMNTVTIPVIRYVEGRRSAVDDAISMEEPLEIFVDDRPFHVTMRLPGEEIPLAVGLCFSEGIIESMDDLAGANYCSDVSANKIKVYLSTARKSECSMDFTSKRSVTYSSCGICGYDMIKDVHKSVGRIDRQLAVSFSTLAGLQKSIEEKQEIFRATGGTHCAGIFDGEGKLLSFSEDVGRHNALDKAIGKILLARHINEAAIVLLSSRLSYEMVQKAARLGAGILAGASTATSLAVELAKTVNLTLVGFLRGNRGNVYVCPERIVDP